MTTWLNARNRAVPSCAALMMVGALLFGLVAPRALANAEPETQDMPSDVGLFVSGDEAQETFLPLDPQTLEDAAAPQLDLGEGYMAWAFSADGSTFVRVAAVDDGVIVHVHDGLSGPERLTFRPEMPAWNPWLSGDGSRLVLFNDAYYVFETETGRLVSTIAATGQDVWPLGFGGPMIDPDGRRLYRAFVDDSSSDEGPWPLQLAVYDLTTEEAIAHQVFSDVLAGEWSRGRVDQVPVFGIMAPGVALSPDGHRLAIVHPGGEAVTLVDAGSLEVIGTHALARPTSLVDRFFGWILPRDAEAKFGAGSVVHAVYAEDGRHLYVYGRESSVGDTAEDVSERGYGIKLVDAETGEIVAEALDRMVIEDLLIAPDGAAIYASGPRTPRLETIGSMSPQVIRRLDPASLEVQAERAFAGYRRFLLLPRAALASTRLPVRA